MVGLGVYFRYKMSGKVKPGRIKKALKWAKKEPERFRLAQEKEHKARLAVWKRKQKFSED